MTIGIKKVRDPAHPEDGVRVLVDRLWPRGVSKGKAAVDIWLKDVSPSEELRKWFAHSPARWEEFKRRYEAELHSPERQEAIERIRREARAGPVTLLFAASDTRRNNAVVLMEFLQQTPKRRVA